MVCWFYPLLPVERTDNPLEQKEEQHMLVHLLKVTYQQSQSPQIEAILATMARPPLSMARHGEECLAVLADHRPLKTESLVLQQVGVSCTRSQALLVRLTLTSSARSPADVLATYPILVGDELFLTEGRVVYLGLGMPSFAQQQICWLAACDQIAELVFWFPLKRRSRPQVEDAQARRGPRRRKGNE
jgi:hypothetical protein